jgi:hypothetical protein
LDPAVFDHPVQDGVVRGDQLAGFGTDRQQHASHVIHRNTSTASGVMIAGTSTIADDQFRQHKTGLAMR